MKIRFPLKFDYVFSILGGMEPSIRTKVLFHPFDDIVVFILFQMVHFYNVFFLGLNFFFQIHLLKHLNFGIVITTDFRHILLITFM